MYEMEAQSGLCEATAPLVPNGMEDQTMLPTIVGEIDPHICSGKKLRRFLCKCKGVTV